MEVLVSLPSVLQGMAWQADALEGWLCVVLATVASFFPWLPCSLFYDLHF